MESHELEECEPLLELFWLENPPENTLKLIIQTLFGWDDCLACDRSGTCPLWNCTWNRRQLLDQYLEFYRVVSSWSMPEGLNQGNPALRNHDDLTDIIYLIQQRPDLPRKELIQIHFSSYRSALPDPLDQNRAFDLAMRVLTMIECSPRRCSRVNWSPGFAPIPWYADDSARQFIGRAFQRHAALDVEDEFDRSTFGKLAATSLERRKKIKLVGTYDLQKHLLLEPESRTLYIYHHVGFLKEYLAATRQPTSNIP